MVRAHGTFRSAPGHVPRSGFPVITDRMVKYIANSAAKNMSSLANQTMMPTLTRSGRFATPCAGVGTELRFAVAVATGALLRHPAPVRTRPPEKRRISVRIGRPSGPVPQPARDQGVTVAHRAPRATIRRAQAAVQPETWAVTAFAPPAGHPPTATTSTPEQRNCYVRATQGSGR